MRFSDKTHRVPPSRCTACGKLNDSAGGVNTSPEPGDYVLCIGCGHLMAYADDMSLRNLTNEEAREAAGSKRIKAVRAAILKLRANG